MSGLFLVFAVGVLIGACAAQVEQIRTLRAERTRLQARLGELQEEVLRLEIDNTHMAAKLADARVVVPIRRGRTS